MNRISEFQLGWIVGIMEGEGWFVKNPKTPRASVAMTDYDTIEKFIEIVGVGHLSERHFKGNKKSQLAWNLGVYEDLEDFLTMIIPHMSARRSERIKEVLDVLSEKRIQREWRLEHFVCGHPKTEDNTYNTNQGKTVCRTCSLAQVAARYAASKHPTTTISKEIA